ncbi:MAG: hypothetical protein Q6364_04485 [Candidatus Hermodarchaeota archaeon]|nr:hypothetical protein [Candidatus Hermodarchaeota archaeon]
MALIGLILLLAGGGILLYSGTSIAIDVGTALALGEFLNTIIGAPNGHLLVGILLYFTSLGGIFVIVGSILWYAAGEGIFALIGKILVMLATFSAFYYLALQILSIIGLGIFSLPIQDIIFYFLTSGIGVTAVILIIIGDMIGAGRKKKENNNA